MEAIRLRLREFITLNRNFNNKSEIIVLFFEMVSSGCKFPMNISDIYLKAYETLGDLLYILCDYKNCLVYYNHAVKAI